MKVKLSTGVRKRVGCNAARIGDVRDAVCLEKSIYDSRNQRSIAGFVQYIRREHYVEAGDVGGNRAPVDECRSDFIAEITEGIGSREGECVFIVIGRRNVVSSDRCGDAYQADTGAKFDETSARSWMIDDEVGENGGRGPEFGPVR